MLSACLPPLMTFMHGTGSSEALLPPEIAVQRHPQRVGGGSCHGHRHGQDGIRPQLGLVRRSVQFDHQAVDGSLIEGVFTDQQRSDLGHDVLDGLPHALAAVSFRVAIPKLDGFPFAGRCPGRHDRRADRPVFQRDLSFNGRVASGIENFLSGDVLDVHDHSSHTMKVNHAGADPSVGRPTPKQPEQPADSGCMSHRAAMTHPSKYNARCGRIPPRSTARLRSAQACWFPEHLAPGLSPGNRHAATYTKEFLRTDSGSLTFFRQRIADFLSPRTDSASLRLVAEAHAVGDAWGLVHSRTLIA